MCSPERCTIFILIPAHAVSPIDSSYNYDQTMSPPVVATAIVYFHMLIINKMFRSHVISVFMSLAR